MTTEVVKELLYKTRSREVVFTCLVRGLTVRAHLKNGADVAVNLAGQTHQVQGGAHKHGDVAEYRVYRVLLPEKISSLHSQGGLDTCGMYHQSTSPESQQ